ncbi:MAG TPA: Rrf2 family transcriptional regulator [Halanaerobiales bacterium]|nr:Rrf2 family transcriptional regulator [Halanaerobiales bacterium]
MKISTRGRYGLRALVDLAKNESGPVPLREISVRQQISEQYLEQLFVNLRKTGIVKSVRGAYGGYLLNRLPDEITIKEIITALEGPIAPADCVLDGESCEDEINCVTHNLWLRIKEELDKLLNSITLENLIEKEQNNE